MIYDTRHEAFAEVIRPEARLSVIAGGFTLTEGTVWSAAEGCLYFSEIPSSTVYRWTEAGGPVPFRRPSNLTNGNAFDREGRLLSCEHGTSAVSRLEEGKRHFRVLASHYEGKEFNSPNDIVCDSKGRIWFTDPPYGRTSPRVGVIRPLAQPICGVYRIDPDGTVARVAEDFETPNGLCFLPGETELLINDTNRMHIRRFTPRPDGTLADGGLFAEVSGPGEGKPDGMKADTLGRIYCTGPGGVHVFAPDGGLLGVFLLPEQCRNLCFGGPTGQWLFFGCSSAVYRLEVKARGLASPEV